MKRFYYSDSIANFISVDSEKILGILAKNNEFPLEQTQKEAWIQEIDILKPLLKSYQGSIYFEYSIPRMGQRIDVVLLIGPVVYVIEFKVGERHYPSYAVDQVFDYALDLKNFHETSHNQYIAPILISTEADPVLVNVSATPQNDKCLFPIYCNTSTISNAIERTRDSHLLNYCIKRGAASNMAEPVLKATTLPLLM